MPEEKLALAAIWYVAFLLSLTCHEAAHALAAKVGGDPTAYESGQVTLNPLPHIRREPFGTVLIPAITYFASGFMMGWASAPYDPGWQQRHPKRAALMAMAGPAANFLLAAASAIAIRVGLAAGFFTAPDRIGFSHMTAAAAPGAAEGLATLLSILFSLNLLLGAFNLLPVPPLDGSNAVGLFLSDRMALRFVELGRGPMFSLVGLLIAWRLFDYVAGPLFRAGIRLLYGV
ncbi:MAG: site-2 protease family protein [Acidobacteriota bacterium]